MKYDYNTLVEKLRGAVVTVTFEKVDGTTRVMRCTLLPEYLPEEYRGNAPLLTETTPQTVSVWDVEASGWRSFRVDFVRGIE